MWVQVPPSQLPFPGAFIHSGVVRYQDGRIPSGRPVILTSSRRSTAGLTSVRFVIVVLGAVEVAGPSLPAYTLVAAIFKLWSLANLLPLDQFAEASFLGVVRSGD